ncbi:hypothetical protein GXY_10044 [Novacetimonas hansenii ATCC 23769]|uniref:Uncharacterized protein n=1 Tax=Novacetimonas hansenii ATCC 23769 TaxID=714995 RepID=D5QFT9_NOVHA|nr:hypothetical protein GXY_10044 [Novacetimonas hansenii ATCC 23769]
MASGEEGAGGQGDTRLFIRQVGMQVVRADIRPGDGYRTNALQNKTQP